MQQAKDFFAESEDVFALVSGLSEEVLTTATAFKQWSIADIIQHLHFWNEAALLSLSDAAGFEKFFKPVGAHIFSGKDLKSYEREYFANVSASELIAAWQSMYRATAAAFEQADPSQRVAWVGPSMSARSSITARQMETWSHAQAIYDVLGIDRVDQDRIRNIVVLGINTYGWTFVNRKIDVPDPMPYVRLVSPSGDVWNYGDPQEDNCIQGSAVAFAQVVTQTRNVVDTNLQVVGDNANLWMTNAQCFAGAPNPVPEPGVRCKAPV